MGNFKSLPLPAIVDSCRETEADLLNVGALSISCLTELFIRLVMTLNDLRVG